MQSRIAVFVFVGVIAFVGYKIYDAQHSGNDSPTTTPAQDAAALLQTYDRADGHPADIADYQAALDKVTAKCTNSPTDIGHFVANAKADLVRNGITDETELSVLKHLDGSLPDGTHMDCQGVLAAYLVLREQGS